MAERRRVYTLDEVAELLGVSRTTVSRLVRAGKLRVARIGQRTARVTDAALDAFLEEHEETGRESFPYRHNGERKRDQE